MADNSTANGVQPGLPTDNRTAILYCIIGTLVPFTAVVLGLRFYSRRFLTNTLGADDWVCLISMVSAFRAGIPECPPRLTALCRSL